MNGNPLGIHDLDLPFEEQEPSPMNPAEAPRMAGGLVIGSLVVDVPGVGMKPGLLFQFVAPDGRFYQPVMYVADDDQFAKLRPLILEAVASARRAASRASVGPVAALRPDCPECAQGKHQNCTEQIPAGGDDLVECPCKTRGHQ